MSKSLGNTALVDEVVRRVRPVELRYYLVAPHYRSTIEFTDAALAEAGAAYQRIESFVRRAAERVGADSRAGRGCCDEFRAALDDDLGTPAAIAAIHETVRQGNTALAADDDAATAGAARCGPGDARRARSGPARPAVGRRPAAATTGWSQATDGLVALALEQRQAARARKDFAAADAIRDQLTTLGVTVEDTPHGPRWELSR